MWGLWCEGFSPSTSVFLCQYHSNIASQSSSSTRLPEGLYGEACEPSQKQNCFGIWGGFDRNYVCLFILKFLKIVSWVLVAVNTSRLCCKYHEILHINPEESVCRNTDYWMVCREWRERTKWQSWLSVYCVMTSYSLVGSYKSFGVTGCVYDWNISVIGWSRVDHNKRHEKLKSHDMLTNVSFFDDYIIPGLVFW